MSYRNFCLMCTELLEKFTFLGYLQTVLFFLYYFIYTYVVFLRLSYFSIRGNNV